MTVEEIKEVKEVNGNHKDYASKTLAGTALGFGIGGAALSLWNTFNKKGGLGGHGMPENVNINTLGGVGSNGPTAFQAWEKECEDALALTSAIYQGRITQMNERFSDRQVLNGELFGLYKSQTDSDFGLYKNQRDSYDVLKSEIDGLKTQVTVGAAVRPYQDKLIQCEIDKAFNAGINYTDRRMCKVIEGEVVLPNTPVVQGFGSYQSCRGNGKGCSIK